MKNLLRTLAVSSLLLGIGAATQPAAAQTKKAASAFTIQKATIRKTVSLSAKKENNHGHDHNGREETVFEITWNSATPPTQVFYRPDKAHWLKCEAARPEKRSFGGGPNDFMVMEMRTAWKDFKPGGNYILRPEELPSELQPDEVKSQATGAIFYKVGNSKKWQIVKVQLTRLPDLKRP